MYVYQITNLINNKKYIGITNDYLKRWSNEKSYPKDPKRRQAIQEAIHKYGKENFSFEVLFSHLSIEDAVWKEEQLIQELNTLVPNGYNVDQGGKYHPNHQPKWGAENGNALLTEEEAQYIKDHRNIPAYVLFEEFSDRISYETFLKCYNHKTYKNLIPKVEPYPHNREFSSQFTSAKLEYPEVVELREKYSQGVYWKTLYNEKYKEIYKNPMSFWNVYNGKSYVYVMPEVFTEENKKLHACLARGGENNGKSTLKEEDVRNIRRLNRDGVSNKELYELYPQVTPTTIRDIIHYKTWKKVLID